VKRVALRFRNDGKTIHVQVVGLSSEVLSALRDAALEDRDWNRILSMHVVDDRGAAENVEPAPPAMPAMLGSYSAIGEVLSFQPRFPLRPGMSYRAVFDPAPLAEFVVINPAVETGPFPKDPIESVMTMPSPPPSPPTTVVAVYPSADALPENQLKFYLHFSAPMGRGDSFRHVKLLRASGEEVPIPFLELEEELWDADLQRFTLIFEPGRVKRGVELREEMGPALVAGESYALVIDKEWRDASGKPLRREFRKQFRVTPLDTTQPDPKLWKVSPPQMGTRHAVVVEFNEPLDRAMLDRVIQVAGADGKLIAGEIEVDRGELRWRFTPDKPWPAGRYELVIAGTLEDLAGNSVGKLFEVAMPEGKPTTEKVAEEARVAFEVK
jgi:hypothetical protein